MKRPAARSCVGLIGALLLTAGCSEQAKNSKQVETPNSWRLIELGAIAFRFPTDRTIDGHDNRCGVASVEQPDCVLPEEGPVLTHRSGTFTLQSRDDYGDTGPAAAQLGDAMWINGRKIHREVRANDTRKYVVTAGVFGDDAKTMQWLKLSDAVLWMTCRSEPDCLLAEQVAGSVEQVRRSRT